MAKHGYSTIGIVVAGPQGSFHQEISVRNDLLDDTPRAEKGREAVATRLVSAFAELYRQAHEPSPAASEEG
jgi:hypothetical protein